MKKSSFLESAVEAKKVLSLLLLLAFVFDIIINYWKAVMDFILKNFPRLSNLKKVLSAKARLFSGLWTSESLRKS